MAAELQRKNMCQEKVIDKPSLAHCTYSVKLLMGKPQFHAEKGHPRMLVGK